MAWLKEMEIVEAVRDHLVSRGFDVNRMVRKATEKGTDIIAISPSKKKMIKIEAKGQTSSNVRSKRYGKEFTRNQKEDHLGRALLKCLSYLDEGFAAGIALPGDEYNMELVDRIKKELGMLGIVVLLADEEGVSCVGNLPE